jgi:hypothetical protein
MTYQEVALHLARSHWEVFGEAPTSNRLGVAWAQVMLETGRGTKLWGYNFGNIICSPHWMGEFQVLRDEVGGPANYRAYPTADAGAAGYWKLLRRRYGAALAFFDRGQPEAAARELHRLGYFTAAPEPVAKTFGALYAEFNERFARPSWAGMLAPLALIAVGYATKKASA